MIKTERSILLKISELVSNIFNPLASLLLFFAYFCSRHFSLQGAFTYFLPVFLIVVLPVILWILYNVKTGRYKDANVSDRRKRMSLYFFLEAALAAYIAYRYFADGETDLVSVFLLALLIVMHISNYFIKSSMHTAVNVFVATLFSTESLMLGAVWLALSAVVASTRVFLKRHTVAEVITGGLIAGVISFIFLYLNIQNNHGL